jgi:oligopeptide transport system substrate-binding protein
MALNFALSCRRRRSRPAGADFGKKPVGTGAFKLAEWTLGPEGSCSRRTPTTGVAGVPYLDKITFEVGQEPVVALLRLQKGEVDIPATAFRRRSSPR